MQIKQVRNQMWVFEDDQPIRQAQESEVKRWATTKLIQSLKADAEASQNGNQNYNLKSA
jgi:hypothetical protein